MRKNCFDDKDMEWGSRYGPGTAPINIYQLPLLYNGQCSERSLIVNDNSGHPILKLYNNNMVQ